jgi:hypothetical protein
VNKVDLLGMDAADMVDVIHYFFDEDMRYGSIEAAQIHGVFRDYIYNDLYKKPHVYSLVKPPASRSTFSEDGTEVKPYIPPTEFDAETGIPLTDSLDAPLR